MDIRDSIRKRIKEAQGEKKSQDQKTTSTSAKVGKWDPDTQPNIYELNNFLRKSGYRLVDIVSHEGASPELLIEAISKDYLHPDISHDIEDGLFYAKVTEHGLLVSSDLEEIIKGYTTAQGVLKHLENLDLDTLELDEEE